MKEKQLLIIECIPQSRKMNEWLVLRELLKMSVSNRRIRIKKMPSKYDVIDYMKNDLSRFDYIHLSSHGSANECALKVGNGRLKPNDFPEGCFYGKTVTFSACELGQKSFSEPFMRRTYARSLSE